MVKINPVNKALLENNDGSTIVLALLLLSVLTVVGISSINTSSIETKIAANDNLYKIAFYSADGGTEVARELIEQNLGCPNGFENAVTTIGTLEILDDKFAYEESAPGAEYPSDTTRDIRFPNDDTQPHVNIVSFGNSQLSTGSALHMAAGYEGKGKGAAGGGGQIMYDVYAKHEGRQNSKACIMINYRHIIGQEGVCKY